MTGQLTGINVKTKSHLVAVEPSLGFGGSSSVGVNTYFFNTDDDIDNDKCL